MEVNPASKVQRFSATLTYSSSVSWSLTLIFNSVFPNNDDEDSLQLPPSAPYPPFIGHLHHLLSPRLFQSSHNLSLKYGSILHLCLGATPCLLLLVPRQIQRSRAIRREEIKRLIEKMANCSKEKRTVELGAEVLKLTNNVVCQMAMTTRKLFRQTFELGSKLCFGDVLGPFKWGIYWLYVKKTAVLTPGFDKLLETVLQKAGDEIETVVGRSKLAADYIHLYLFALRECRQQCNVGGYDLPEKMFVAINLYSIMRDSNVWHDPDTFMLERFLVAKGEDEEGDDESGVLLVRASGLFLRWQKKRLSRITVSTLVHFTIAAMVQCFDWKVGDGDGARVDMEPGTGLTMRMSHALCRKVLKVIRVAHQMKHSFVYTSLLTETTTKESYKSLYCGMATCFWECQNEANPKANGSAILKINWSKCPRLYKESYKAIKGLDYHDYDGSRAEYGCTIYGGYQLAIKGEEEIDTLDEKGLKKSQNTRYMDIFIAGTDTAADTIQWALAELINHPHIFRKVREEIETVVERSKLVEESDIPNLSYLQAVVKGALRLHPPALITTRECRQQCKVAGYDMPEKTSVAISLHSIMRDPNVWDDPSTFRPERFKATKGEDEEDYENVGDGDGARVDNEPGTGITMGMAHPFLCLPIIHLDHLGLKLVHVNGMTRRGPHANKQFKVFHPELKSAVWMLLSSRRTKLAHHMKDLLFSYPLSSHTVWTTFSVGVPGEGMEGFHTPESRGENATQRGEQQARTKEQGGQPKRSKSLEI
ncbi:hypothetical protein Cgig2_021734 [Carnegiea gigantea]|uniref:Cytochrome P450 n=1 Tax=Carnegiea gigantea TaxID=171969 RepID=A0A9Q1K344_9CARY|nr:hypothetical protein Cgig2_021734 [Carnegiea gigantea]